MYAEAGAETRAPPWSGLTHALLNQRGALVHWVPVCLAVGIGGWFALRFEPGLSHYSALGAAIVLCVMAARYAHEAVAPLFVGLALIGAGAGLAGLRAHSVAAPVLEFRYYGPIEGRVVGIDRSSGGAVRLTLDHVRLDDVRPSRVPDRVRLSLYGSAPVLTPEPGMVVMATGHLSPPGGPIEPGGFDFARRAWFERLGAVGYTRVPVLEAAPPDRSWRLAIFRIRMALSRGLQASMHEERGAFATAILTGDRSAIPPDALEDLRASNLAHLLAISGLHMGLLTGVVFGALRAGLALFPPLALRLPCKKIAAAGALMAGFVYLLLSGGNVATLRAFTMVAVVLVAALLDRRAISLRSVAIAAVLILAMTPEALLGPGFQMSFSATVALVAVFSVVWRDWMRGMPAWVTMIAATVLSSAVAGAATAPYAAAHFNRIADYGLLANLMAVPVMGTIVMPAAVAASVLAPVGLAEPALWVMGQGLAWILWVAGFVSGLEGSVSHVVAPAPAVLPLLSFGALFLLLWRGAFRWAGLVPCLAALVLWAQTERPALLIAQSGGLVGVMGPEGRALSKPKGDGFTASVWLENDGDGADQAEAASRPGLDGSQGDRRAELGSNTVRHITGRGRTVRASEPCVRGLVVVNTSLELRPPGPCHVLDTDALRRSGSVAVYVDGASLRLVSANETVGDRLWRAR